MIELATPLPSPEALKLIAQLQAMPTDQGSAALSALSADIRKLSLFSARTTRAHYLFFVRTILEDYAAGKINMATAVMKCQEWLKNIGYSPEKGFPDVTGQGVPPASTLLQNLASSPRIELVIDTLTRRAQSTAWLQKTNTEDANFNYPCWQFLRLYSRLVPRGSSDREDDPSWEERWVRSGGTLYGPGNNIMIATKDDEVWDNISDSGIWPDGLDADTDPVVFNTGYGRLDVDRDRCIELGVIDADEGAPEHRISLLGAMFEKDPAKLTLSEVAAKRSDLLGALAILDKAA